jgi:hypothetical protein
METHRAKFVHPRPLSINTLPAPALPFTAGLDHYLKALILEKIQEISQGSTKTTEDAI